MHRFQNQQRVVIIGRPDLGTILYNGGFDFNGVPLYRVMFDDGTHMDVPQDKLFAYREPVAVNNVPTEHITTNYTVEIDSAELSNLKDEIQKQHNSCNLLEMEVKRLKTELQGYNTERFTIKNRITELNELLTRAISVIEKIQTEKLEREDSDVAALHNWLKVQK
jgi:predicted RNase H-like nuclease (RuvC/YqgF family)